MSETTDILGRTPVEIERDRERARQNRERITARDWHEVPKGHYAVPVVDWVNWDCEEDDEPATIGYRLFERKIARRAKNGRVLGRDRFIHGRAMIVDGADPEQVRDAIDSDHRIAINVFGPGGDLKEIVDQLVRDVEGDDRFRALFGKLTGRCGCCGRKLTDPRSKMLGIGPECRGYR